MQQLSPRPPASSHDLEPTLVQPPRDFREPGSAPRWRLGVGAVVVAVIVLLGVGVVFSAVSSAGAEAADPVGARANAPGASSSVGAEPSRSSTAPSPAGTVFVHILGQIARPGLYEVAPDARAIDVVTAAGGFTAAADQAALNLARPVVDGEQIVVPKPGEAPAPTAAPIAGAGDPAGADAPVDLNTADATALQALPGVGPATAQAILDWRAEHSRFESVDDLLDVTGIGDKKLERLRDSVTVR
ncbi:hypothetical protein AX769_14260 [Frondihabitans sp. PAMC 28766]|uniref:ComEA family DNA-binding protein n=1 Tax=Frondihabitans sp. PAMC 28766 TaxID=1795630 RepID=UPI00078E299C|nr:helix-hairpin-helix domain-containing protein [Frondihabitans sp. PAMC 28766]AMM21088.1 hypothetical protein AX769_14260 [Frondihabitans sp. PAMC 28766]